MQAEKDIRVVLFTGGRGSSVLSQELLQNPRIQLTLAINGYDDGLSTGEVRRFVGDSLGPSDFRKNASYLASMRRLCSEALISLLNFRFPDGLSNNDAIDVLGALSKQGTTTIERLKELDGVWQAMSVSERDACAERLRLFLHELRSSTKGFSFSDCSVGNLVFAGSFLKCGRDFNRANDDYCALLQIPADTILNVTTGENLFLAAVTTDGRFLSSEAAIVSSAYPQQIRSVYLLPDAATLLEAAALRDEERLTRFLDERQVTPKANPKFLNAVAKADLIVYAPGTQHSSLFPSYLTEGCAEAIAANLRAIKILITNLKEDMETLNDTATDIAQNAVHYLNRKGVLSIESPLLITHYLINDPQRSESATPYVPLGNLNGIGDPRLVRIANYENAASGRHDAQKVLTPFIEALSGEAHVPRIAVVLSEADSLSKVTQSLLEIVRGDPESSGVKIDIFCDARHFDGKTFAAFPFSVESIDALWARDKDDGTKTRISTYDYVLLFESTGMYRGEDVVAMCASLSSRRLDALWGSRRLSLRDIKYAYTFIYKEKTLRGLISYLGSYLLSLSYLVFYGQYISDSFSGLRAVRPEYVEDLRNFRSRSFNHLLLSRLLNCCAEIVEVPVWYFPVSPELGRRTTIGEGLSSLKTIMMQWLKSPRVLRSETRRRSAIPRFSAELGK